MAKRKSMVKYRTRYVARAKRAVRRYGRAHGTVTGVALGAYIVGALEKQGVLAKIPTVVADPVLNVGLVAYAASKWGKVGGKWLKDAAIGAIAVGAYRMGAGQTVMGMDIG